MITLADVSILVALSLPYICSGYAKRLAKGTFDNAAPRAEGTYVGKALRAFNAHLNGFETFPFFAVSVLFAEFRGSPQNVLNLLAIAYIVLRIIYSYLYVNDRPTWRSAIFSTALLINLCIFLLPLIR